MTTDESVEDIAAIEMSPMAGLLVIAFAAAALVAIGFGLGFAAAGLTC